jgi:hypothetical protein
MTTAPPATPAPRASRLPEPMSWATVSFSTAWVSTGLMIVFMFVTMIYLRALVGDDGMHWLRNWFWVAMLFYIGIQIWATLLRVSTELNRFFVDFILSIVGVIVGVAVISLGGFGQFPIEEQVLLLQMTGFGILDLFVGVLASMRIAFAGKERDTH